jgi:hypothetical protein
MPSMGINDGDNRGVVEVLIVAGLCLLAVRGGMKALGSTRARVASVRAKSGRIWLAVAVVIAVGFAAASYR